MENLNKLKEVQQLLKAPKNQRNTFGNYNYRSCEDILEAVKPHLNNLGLSLLISDSIEAVSDRVYVKATARLYDGKELIAETSAFAREPQEKKGMDTSQITGATSSYARKYALNGLFAIDDTKDADTMDNRESAKTKADRPKPQTPDIDTDLIEGLKEKSTVAELNKYVTQYKDTVQDLDAFRTAYKKKLAELKKKEAINE